MAHRSNLLKITDESGTISRFPMMPTGKGGQGYALQTRPWEPGDPASRWRIPLHPWKGGVNVDRLRGTPTHSKANADTSHDGMLLFPPLVNSVALTNGSAPAHAVSFDGLLFIVGGRYMYYYNAATGAATEDKDFGASKAAVAAVAFNNELIVAMGESEKIWKRSIGVNTSGTANAAVTTTNTTLVDTRLALTVDAYIGATVTCDSKTMVVTSNTATTFTGASWSGGGNPGDGDAWTVAGTWTQASDATYAISLGVVDNKLHRAETKNRLSSCAGTPLTLANWTPASPNQYYVGDSTYSIHTIADYGGIPWAFNDLGAWAPDPQSRFKNQTPQLRNAPDSDNGRGAFTGFGFLWVPSVSGLFRIRPGESKKRGPEITNRPGYRFHVHGGVEWGEALYLLVSDHAAAGNTAIYKVVPDHEGLTGHDYIYYEWCQLDGTDETASMIAVTSSGTNPQLVVGYANNLRYIKLGRGGGCWRIRQ